MPHQAVSHDELIARIRSDGVAAVAQVVREGFVVEGLRDGADWTQWWVRSVPGALLFFRTRGEVISDETRVLCVNAPEGDRSKWQAIVAESDAPTILVMAPDGRVDSFV